MMNQAPSISAYFIWNWQFYFNLTSHRYVIINSLWFWEGFLALKIIISTIELLLVFFLFTVFWPVHLPPFFRYNIHLFKERDTCSGLYLWWHNIKLVLKKFSLVQLSLSNTKKETKTRVYFLNKGAYYTWRRMVIVLVETLCEKWIQEVWFSEWFECRYVEIKILY